MLWFVSSSLEPGQLLEVGLPTILCMMINELNMVVVPLIEINLRDTKHRIRDRLGSCLFVVYLWDNFRDIHDLIIRSVSVMLVFRPIACSCLIVA
jgi:hypothetical protein